MDHDVDLWVEHVRSMGDVFGLPARHHREDLRIRSERVLDELYFGLLDLLRPDAFIEAGAHEAAAARRAAALCPEAETVAFEASPSVFAHYSSTTSWRDLGVDYRNAALAASAGTVSFRDTAVTGDSGTSSLMSRPDHEPEGARVVEVPAVRLDDAAPPGRLALWVDVEGANGPVLAGAHEALRRCDLLKIEVECRTMWDGQILMPGVLAVLLDAGLLPVARDVLNADQFNIVAVRRSLRDTDGASNLLEVYSREARTHPGPELLERARRHPAYARASRVVRGLARG